MKPIFRQALCLALCGILMGCAAPRQGVWDQRVGNYTLDQALEDMGAPDSYKELSDGSVVAQWLVKREAGWADVFAIDADFNSPSLGINPVPFDVQAARDRYVRLTFGPDRRLRKWKRVYV